MSGEGPALGEGSCFEEIGKRGIWSAQRHSASAPGAAYSAIALDTDTADDPAWTHGVLVLCSTRAAACKVLSLPVRSFRLEEQAELAFRVLQSGLNTGKVVVRLSACSAEARTSGSHVITGGTGGLGMLTARWLSQLGAERVGGNRLGA